jgi:hypothetical protein
MNVPRKTHPLLATLLLALVALPAAAAEVTGVVTNGTTGQPVAGQSVSLIALRGQMVPVGEAQTGADGRYRFVVAANPNERFLVQVPFQGVNYSEPALFTGGDTITADIEVFDSHAPAQAVSIEAHTIFLQPQPGHVRVTEFYLTRNSSQPPRTYAPDGGSFRFALPPTVGDLQVSAGRSGGVSLRQSPQPTDKQNVFSIDYAMKPGDTEIQLSYAVPMDGTTLDFQLPLLAQTPRRHVAVPRQGVKVDGVGLTEVQQTQAPQVRVYSVGVQAPNSLSLHMEVDPAALQAAAAAPAAGEEAPAGEENQVKILPHPVTQARWYIVALTLLVLSLGLYYLYSLQPALKKSNAASAQPDHGRPGERPARG